MHLVFLHGPEASGKLTTAQALHHRLGYPVFHNHLVVGLLTTVFPFGSEPFVRLREQFWTAVFADAARVGRSLIVDGAGGHVHFVRLQVSEAEQERRIGSDSRRRFHKLTAEQRLGRYPGSG